MFLGPPPYPAAGSATDRNVSVFLINISAKGLLGKPKEKRLSPTGPEIWSFGRGNYFYLILVSYLNFINSLYLFTSRSSGLKTGHENF